MPKATPAKSDSSPCHQLEVRRFLMACQFEVLLNAGRPINAGDAAMAALDRIEWLEQTLSAYIPESELSRLNAASVGSLNEISNDVVELLKIGIDVFHKTEGAFDITAASLSEAWGFARRQGCMPSLEQIEQALSQVGTKHLILDEQAKTLQCQCPGLKINSGGIGKGYALDRASQIMRSQGVDHFLIHGGKSSVLACGDRHDIDSQSGWRIAISHPEQPRIRLGDLTLFNSAIGTSGPANQFFYYNGVRYGHIVDPRTGWPASGMLSITVLHPSAAYADALATGLFVMGIDAAIQYCETHCDTGIIAILPTKRSGTVEVVTSNLGRQIWRQAV
ncbi:MAG: FAD:protein FMN transferase [Pirellulaceae bacterium]|nr:FAD:protein FMN transferase [Pirellulaceae bacterium]